MIKPSKHRIAGWGVGSSLVVGIAAFVIWTSLSTRRGPILFCSAFDPTSGMAIVELTNTTTRSWLFQLHSVQGIPRPAYFITPEKKGLPGWGIEVEEGIYCSGYLYRRDDSGGYLPPEVPGPSPKLSVAFTNIVLYPQQVLTFSVPIRGVHGLSKMGVTYHRPPTSSRLGRTAADALARLRHILGLRPARPFQGWCETPLPSA